MERYVNTSKFEQVLSIRIRRLGSGTHHEGKTTLEILPTLGFRNLYIGQPEASVDAAIVYYPFDLIKLNITDDAYRRYYSCRHDLYEDKRSTPTKVGEILRENERDITKVLELETANDADPPLTANFTRA